MRGKILAVACMAAIAVFSMESQAHARRGGFSIGVGPGGFYGGYSNWNRGYQGNYRPAYRSSNNYNRRGYYGPANYNRGYHNQGYYRFW